MSKPSKLKRPSAAAHQKEVEDLNSRIRDEIRFSLKLRAQIRKIEAEYQQQGEEHAENRRRHDKALQADIKQAEANRDEACGIAAERLQRLEEAKFDNNRLSDKIGKLEDKIDLQEDLLKMHWDLLLEKAGELRFKEHAVDGLSSLVGSLNDQVVQLEGEPNVKNE